MQLRARFFVVALAVALFGCSAAAKRLFTAPTIAFRGVALESISPFGGRVRVSLLVRNPNPYSVSTSGMTYELFGADTVAVARRVDTLTRTVSRHDSLLASLPLDVGVRGLRIAGTAGRRCA